MVIQIKTALEVRQIDNFDPIQGISLDGKNDMAYDFYPEVTFEQSGQSGFSCGTAYQHMPDGSKRQFKAELWIWFIGTPAASVELDELLSL